jgi:DNA-binding HxlR family transcriptional regulator
MDFPLSISFPKGSSILRGSILYLCNMKTKLADGHISADCWQRLRAINDTKDVLSGKWKVMIIACLASFGKKRYMEIQRLLAGIGTKMLSKELQELEINGLITQTVMNTKPITVDYELTSYGRSLKPIIDEMALWGIHHRGEIIGEITQKK